VPHRGGDGGRGQGGQLGGGLLGGGVEGVGGGGVEVQRPDRPVVDQTGLDNRYDIQVDWQPDEFQFRNGNQGPPPQTPAATTPAADAPPDIITAFREQLGLKLEATKAPADVYVIDKVSRPSEN